MGWQKRGSGRAYDSKSGVGTLIGNRTGKICGYGIRSKDCRKCTFHTNKGNVPPPHSCHRNWNGSSKAMEPDVAVETVQQVEKENVEVGVLIMDDDATTIAKIRQTVPHSVTKWSDLNHTRKHLGNSLYNLQKKHKCLTPKVIQFLQKCFSYAVAQNKGNTQGLEMSLNQIIPHVFGDHQTCDKRWCGYMMNAETYKHKSLPYGRDLHGDELRADLTSVFHIFVSNAEKIAPGGSTKDVESFNNIVASKAPKRCHYSASSSLKNRVNCAVAEKNIGSHYITQVNKSIGLSPGNVYAKHAARKDNTRKRRLLYENTLTFKKRKLERKLNKSVLNAQKELREGVTYKSSVGLSIHSNSQVTEIPAPTLPPDVITLEIPDNCTHIYCDLETTSLSKTCDIVQIAAISANDVFNQYILPSQPIAPGAACVTGLALHGNVLFYHGNPVRTLPLRESLNLFLAWLDERKPCLLIGHNFRTFDFPRLLRAFDKCHLLTSLQNCVVGIVDTLPLFRKQFPDLDKYTQEHLIKHVLDIDYAAHNAEEDVRSLHKLVTFSNVSTKTLSNNSVTFNSALDIYKFDIISHENLETFDVLLEQKVVSKQMLLKMAKSNLRFEHLKLAVERGEQEGLSKLMSEKVNGKPRVTSTRRIIEKLYEFITANRPPRL